MTTATRPQQRFSSLEALRQCHALEHATVWILSEWQPNLGLGGTSTDQGFYIYGPVAPELLEKAAREALLRFEQGETDLAVHPRCGTNLSVGILLWMSLTLGFGAFLPRRPLSQAVGLGFALYGTALLTNTLGALAQRHITTATPRNIQVRSVQPQKDWLGRSGIFVAVDWIP